MRDLLWRESSPGGVFRPRHIGPVKIAAIDRIRMKLFERSNTHALSAPGPPFRWLATLLCLAVAGRSDGGEKFSPPSNRPVPSLNADAWSSPPAAYLSGNSQ
jgi:hypothetical protein